MKKTIYIITLCLVYLISGCKKENILKRNELKETVKIHGNVFDQDMNPLDGVIISFNNKKTASNKGFYVFDDVLVNGGREIVKATLPGYFDAVVGFETIANKSSQLKIVMIKKTSCGTIDGNLGGSVSVGNASIFFPANSITKNGFNFNGTATIYAYHLSPSNLNFSEQIPGGDLVAMDTSNNEQILLSYGMIGVKIEDSNGNELELGNNKKATLKFPIDSRQLPNSPNIIQLWHLNEQDGMWKEEGFATKNGAFFECEVSHFSVWNCDKPANYGWAKGKLYDCNNNPIPYAEIIISDLSTGSSNIPQKTISSNSNGEFLVRVAAGYPILVTILPLGSSVNSKSITIQPIASQQTFDLGRLDFACNGNYKTALVDCNNQAIRGVLRVQFKNIFYNLDAWDGKVNLSLLQSESYIFSPYCFYSNLFGISKNITVNSNTPTDIGNIIACDCDGGANGYADITKTFFTANGVGFSNTYYGFNPTIGSSAIAKYNSQSNIYEVTISGKRNNLSLDSMTLTIQFKGKEKGDYNVQDNIGNDGTATISLIIHPPLGGNATLEKNFYSTNGKLSIAEVSDVGKIVIGFYEGEFSYSDLSNQFTTKATISNGSFHAVRIK